MGDLALDAAVVLLFVLIGGVFAASEMALVTLRESQIRAMAAEGGSGRRVARLTEDPNRYLSAVQIGVTLAGFFSASFGAAQLSPQLTPGLVAAGLPSGVADGAAFVGTTLVIAYLSLVLGELVPKRLAMQSAERVSRLVATPLDVAASLLRPVIWLLGTSVDGVMRLLGRDPRVRSEGIGTEELLSLVAEHEALGSQERAMVLDLLAVGERTVQEIMTPRTEVEFLDAALPVAEARELVRRLDHSRYPVRGEDEDDVLGFVHIRDLADADDGTVRGRAREILRFPTGTRVLAALTEMRQRHAHLAVVVDEYGGTDGVITLEDVVEEFVGQIQDEYDHEEPLSVASGTVESVAGLLGRGDVVRVLGRELPEGPFDTLGGFVMTELGRMPGVGDVVTWDDLVLTVTELDGRRVDRLDVRRVPPAALR